jgi:hypothetical protein
MGIVKIEKLKQTTEMAKTNPINVMYNMFSNVHCLSHISRNSIKLVHKIIISLKTLQDHLIFE